MKCFHWTCGFRGAIFAGTFFAVLFALVPLLVGQTATGAITGVVKDESGAVVPGAMVTVTNTGTGVRRRIPTDAGGRYRVPGLNAGMYQVEARAPGFQTSVRAGLQLTVGRELAIEMLLQLGQVEQVTEVTAEAPLVETVSNTLSGLVDNQTIEELPLNGRSFLELVALQPGVHTFHTRNDDSVASGADISVGGNRSVTNTFILDGIELLGSDFQDGTPGGALSKLMGVDAVQEFNVMTGNYSAAYGKRNGGVVNIMTRPGTNQVHGTVGYFHRNDNFDARNFFDPEEPGEFRRNQFAGSVGGPIIRDRTFIFGSYEGLREGLGKSTITSVPDENARRGLLPDRETGELVDIGLNPVVTPYLNAFFPLPNGRNFGDGTAERFDAPSLVSRQDFWLVRMDHHFSEQDSIFGRYNFSDARFGDPQANPTFIENTSTREQAATLEYKRSYVTLLNSLRFGYTRARAFSVVEPVDPAPFEGLRFIEGADGIGNMQFSEGGGSSVSAALPEVGSDRPQRRYVINQFEAGDQIHYYRGNHSLQFGAKYQWIHNNDNIRGGDDFGGFEFAGLASFLRGEPEIFNGVIPGGSAFKSYRRGYFAAYFQDDFQIRSNLTLNLGLRYENLSVPTEKYDRIGNFRRHNENGWEVPDTNPTVGNPFFKTPKDLFAPRVGFAYDPMGNGRTVFRSGFGMFYDFPLTEWRYFTRNNPPFYNSVSVDNPPFPLGLSGAAGDEAQYLPEGVTFDQPGPTKLQWNFSIQQQVTDRAVFQVAYLGSHAYNLSVMGDNNSAIPTSISADGTKFFAPRLPRRNPNVGRGRDLIFGANADYHSFQFDYSQRVSQGLRAKFSYTWSRNVDDSAGAVTNGLTAGARPNTMDPDDRNRDHGLSSYHALHIVSTNFTYDFPGASLGGAAGTILGGWQLSSIISANTGEPVTVLIGFNQSRNRIGRNADRPDLRPGGDNSPVLGGPDQYFDPTQFLLPAPGTYGNLGRNTLVGPGFFNVDMSLVKKTQIGERWGAEFRAEFFNFFNRANFGVPVNAVFDEDGSIRGNAGRINYTINPSRQIQLALKLTF